MSTGQADPDSPRAILVAEIGAVLNRNSFENAANIPDWVLAEYVVDALYALTTATGRRDNWYGIHPYPGWRSGGPIAPEAPPTGGPDVHWSIRDEPPAGGDHG